MDHQSCSVISLFVFRNDSKMTEQISILFWIWCSLVRNYVYKECLRSRSTLTSGSRQTLSVKFCRNEYFHKSLMVLIQNCCRRMIRKRPNNQQANRRNSLCDTTMRWFPISILAQTKTFSFSPVKETNLNPHFSSSFSGLFFFSPPKTTFSTKMKSTHIQMNFERMLCMSDMAFLIIHFPMKIYFHIH